MSDFLEKFKPNIGVFGVGGAGLNAINNMIFSQLEDITFIAANTDAQSLGHSLAKIKIQLGAKQTRGLGAGANPEIGKISAEESVNEIREVLKNFDMIFIAAGLGGGTGTGAAPIVAKEAKNLGILTVAIVTKPFEFEGAKRSQIANNGLVELEKNVDTLIVIPNDNLIKVSQKDTGFVQSFKMADDVLNNVVTAVSELICRPGLVNRDFADVKTVMSCAGRAMIGYGETTGEDRHTKIIEKICTNEILENSSIDGATNALINITANDKMTIFEIQYIIGEVRKKIDPESDIIFGTVFDPEVEGIKVTIICTGMKTGRKDFFKKKDNDTIYSYEKIKEEMAQGAASSSFLAKDFTVDSSLTKVDTSEAVNDYIYEATAAETNRKQDLDSVAIEISLQDIDIEEEFLGKDSSVQFVDYAKKISSEDCCSDGAVNAKSALYSIITEDLKKDTRLIAVEEENSIIKMSNIIEFPKCTEKIKLFNILKKDKNLEPTPLKSTLSALDEKEQTESKKNFFSFRSRNEDELSENLSSDESVARTEKASNFSFKEKPSKSNSLKAEKDKMPLFDSIYSSLIKNLKEDASEFIKGPRPEVESSDKNKVA
jgi:cell division protein FtsZ